MNDQEKRTLDMFKRVRDFGATHQTLTQAGSLASDLFNIIQSVVGELEEHAVRESTGRGTARYGTVGKGVARAAILEDLNVLRRTARAMAILNPGLADKFRLPHKGDDLELLTTARAALSEAGGEPLRTEFLRREVPESLFQELADNIAAFEAARTGQNTGKDTQTGAGASIDAAIDRGTDALRQLDPIVRNKFRNNPAALAAWLGAKRTERPPRRNNNAPTPPEPPTPDPETPPAPTPNPDDNP